jgi:hypothetical protein
MLTSGTCRAQAEEKLAGRAKTEKSKTTSHCRSRLAFSRRPNETTRSRCQQGQETHKTARGLPRKKTNVEQSKESNCQAGTDDQHNQRWSIEKARPRLDWRLDDMSSFFVHKINLWVEYYLLQQMDAK